MGLVITILKIIGIILLAILALVLVVAATVIFVPVRYRIKADRSDPATDLSAKAFITYLLHIISVRFEYDDGFRYSVKVLGIRIRPKKEKKDKTEDSTLPEVSQSVRDDAEAEPENVQESNAVEYDVQETVTLQSHDEQNDPDISLSDKIDAIIDKIISTYDNMEDKINGIRCRIHSIDKLLNDPHNRNAFDLIKKEVLRLLKKIAPQKVRGFVHFGFEDPATTGKVLMYLALIYPSLPRKLVIDPGWEDTDLYGYLDMKGHLALITVLISLLRLICNKDVRRLWRSYKNRGHKV